MDNFKFPKTYADLDDAPWCYSYEKPDHWATPMGNGCFIHIYEEWFPSEWGERMSACGATLKEALADMQDLWEEMRPPFEV